MKRSLFVKLGVFVVVALVLGVMEFNTLTGPHVGTTHDYHAMFGGTDGVSGLRTGDSVKAAGVAVGKVTGETLIDATHVRVTFTANDNQRLTTDTYASVRYANLLGQRFLALTNSKEGGATLAHGATIPMSHTAPALSLTALFNGFRPLFSGLSPQQVNELSNEIIDVLQGQGAGIEQLIKQTADLTSNLAQRDDTFNQVVDSLSSLLTAVAQHDDQLASTVTSLHALTAQLHADGPAIIDSLTSVDALTGSVAGLLSKLEDHNLPGDIADLNAFTGVLAQNTGALDQLIGGFVTAFSDFSRVSQDGNWVNVYPCIVAAQTFGTAQISAANGVDSLSEALGPQLGGLLASLGLGTSALAQLALPLPVSVPVGQVGSPGQHTKVCK
jgi:phospholipid/cholesterol/gamma-HCH transport system substrate-binding protein